MTDKEKKREYYRKYYKKNKDIIRNNFIKWYSENKQSQYENVKKWQKENIEKYKEARKKQRKRYRKKFPYYNRYKTMIQYELRYHNDHNISIDLMEKIVELFDNKCFKCGQNKTLSFDHNVSVRYGGKFEKSNIVLLCKSCNSKKHSKLPTEFYTQDELDLLEKKYGVISHKTI